MFNTLINLLKIVTLGYFATALLCSQIHALPFSLKPLKAEQVKRDNNELALATVAMIYQPDCTWCKKQGKILAKAFETCQSSVNLALVGTKGNAQQLKKELKYYHKDLPAFQASRRFLRQIGGYQASPTTLIFDASGELIAKKRGFISNEKLAKALVILSQGKCKIE